MKCPFISSFCATDGNNHGHYTQKVNSYYLKARVIVREVLQQNKKKKTHTHKNRSKTAIKNKTGEKKKRSTSIQNVSYPCRHFFFFALNALFLFFLFFFFSLFCVLSVQQIA